MMLTIYGIHARRKRLGGMVSTRASLNGKSPMSIVSDIPAASAAIAAAHLVRRLSVETDCADAAASMRDGTMDFVLLHVVGLLEAYECRHIPGAQHLPHRQITAESLARWPDGTLFVVYCAGP